MGQSDSLAKPEIGHIDLLKLRSVHGTDDFWDRNPFAIVSARDEPHD